MLSASPLGSSAPHRRHLLVEVDEVVMEQRRRSGKRRVVLVLAGLEEREPRRVVASAEERVEMEVGAEGWRESCEQLSLSVRDGWEQEVQWSC